MLIGNRLIRSLLILSAFFGASASDTNAAEFELLYAAGQHKGNWRPGAVRLTGEIVPGDAARLETFLSESFDFYPLVAGQGDDYLIELDSPGGDISEGLKLGDVIFRHGLGTRIRSGQQCLSACAWAFLSGRFIGAVGSWEPRRIVEEDSVLAFHGFYSRADRVEFENVTAASFRTLTQALMSSVARWRVPDLAFLAELFSASPDDMIVINTANSLLRLGISYLPPAQKVSELARGEFACAKLLLEQDSGGWGLLERMGYTSLDEISDLPDGQPFELEMLAESLDQPALEEYGSRPTTSIMRLAVQDQQTDLLNLVFDGLGFALADSESQPIVTGFGRGGGFYFDRCIAFTPTDVGRYPVFFWDENFFRMVRFDLEWLNFVHPNRPLWSVELE